MVNNLVARYFLSCSTRRLLARAWPLPGRELGVAEKIPGFTVVELLVTLVIAVLYVTIFFQLYTLSDTVTTSTYQLAQADQVTYRKVQQYENRSFATIPVLNGSTPTQVEDFTSELPTTLPAPYKAIVLTAQMTPTLKAVTVRTTYGPAGSAQQVIEFADYIQQSGLGR